MDDKDEQILALLKENSKLRTHQISKKTRIPVTTVHNRIKKMESDGIIKNYTVNLNHKKLGKGMFAFILATVNYAVPSGNKISQESVAKKVKLLGAEEVLIVTGGTDIVIRMRTSDVEELNTFIVNKLRTVEGIDKTQTMMVLNEI